MKKIVMCLLLACAATACKEDILEQYPKGSLSSGDLSNKTAAEALVVASYALLDGVYNGPIETIFNPASNWSYSDVRSDDAYKGGGGTGDLGELNSLELGIIAPDNSLIERKWRALYFAVARCNKALKSLNSVPDAGFPEKATRIAEVRVLRAHYYFELKRHFYTFPYLDESVVEGQEGKVANTLTSEQLWQKITDDLTAAALVLPPTQTDLGRVNKFVAYAYLAKVNLYQRKWAETITAADQVINSGQYRLQANLEALYSDPNVEHGGENIFAVETTVTDGSTTSGLLNWGDLLTSPPGPAYGGGDHFHRPSQNLVNAFKVDANGLPLLDTFNNSDLSPSATTVPVDPRLDHAIGRPGITWKDFRGEVYGNNWIREGATYGPYSKKKNIIYVNSPLRAAQGFPWALGALNFPLIKYSDLLLWKAEALIESGGNLEDARALINQIRTRAANTPPVLTLNGAAPAATYRIGTYPTAGWTQAYARKALRMERRLELCMEGHRFYDLVRYGDAAATLTTYAQQETPKRPFLSAFRFTANKNEYLPIPQNEIDRSGGVLTQNQFYR
ncbi:RagB/SusD family nutrient uptake outer membrane protein [Hymenobacter armeniacus]|uniref:RagB/SusD family nutrient uptake outer membrane protein n=1 Tax=Hymenobacter armeniacus TaxID=2771358 RepID=A0ABR8JS28_9BACT|nr:RagB/SusD family nutrient uptake outer membrane protein [Hymenobacter armeniacus]MBD2722767.1 RagB/SusD family nutrient uptake outer membrane protein [Hymenobacter armeniacus]